VSVTGEIVAVGAPLALVSHDRERYDDNLMHLLDKVWRPICWNLIQNTTRMLRLKGLGWP